MKADERVKVFISYSRKNVDFALRILAALEARDVAAKLDTRDLPKLEDWRRELLGFIREADAVVFIVSPNSIASPVCEWEVEQVAGLNKRLAPIVLERVPDDRIPEAIAKINHIFFDPPNDFEEQADALAEALKTNLEWVKNHTRLGELARRWDERGRPSGQTLRGQELVEAEQWIALHPRGAPEPTAVHRRFVSESRHAATRRLRYAVAGSLAVGAFAVALAAFAVVQQRAAEASRANAIRVLATSDFQRGTGFLQNDETTSEGMAHLARAVRRGQDQRALTRLWTLLQQRDFWLPITDRDEPGGATPTPRRPEVPESIKARFRKFLVDGIDRDVEFISVSGDGNFVFTALAGGVGGQDDVQYRIWRINGTPVTPWRKPEYAGDSYVYGAKGFLSFDGRYLALEVYGWREPAFLEIFDVQGNARIGRDIAASGPHPETQNVGFSRVEWLRPKRGGQAEALLVTGSLKGDAAVFRVEQRSLDELTRNRHAGPIVLAALDVNNEWLMSSSTDGAVRISSLAARQIGNTLQLPYPATSIERDGSNLSVSFENGTRRRFSLRPPIKIPLPAGLQIEGNVACKNWKESSGPPGLITSRGELTRLGTRQLSITNQGAQWSKSRVFEADILLVCVGKAGDRLAISTSDFVTEIWPLDFSTRIGLPVVERRLFDAKSMPERTELTIPSPDGKSVAITSYFWDSPNVGNYWFSLWDLDTALPLMDRAHSTDESPGGAQLVRMDSAGRYLVFVEITANKEIVPVTSLQIAAPSSVTSWIADYAEAVAGVSLDDEGAVAPVSGRLEKLKQGSETLAKVISGSNAGK